MNQRINLYKPGKKEPKTGFIFDNVLKGLGAFVLVLFLFSLYEWYAYGAHNRELKSLDEKRIALEQKNQALENMPGRDQMMAELKSLQEKEEQTKQVLATLDQIKKREVVAFSGYLKAFSAKAMQGLWLTGFSLQDSGNYIGFKGESTEAEYIPRLIDGLSQEMVFHGRTFQVFKLNAVPENNRVNFFLETNPNEKFSKDFEKPKGAEKPAEPRKQGGH